jgi:protein CpxP
MKTRYLAIALAGVMVAGAVTAVLAHTHGKGAGMFGHRMGWIARKLDLSDAQKTQIRSMIQAERPNFEPLVKQLAGERQQMLAATHGGSFDEAQVKTLAGQEAQTLADLIVIRERVIANVYKNVLTPEQRTKADGLREHMAEHMLKRFQEQSPQTSPAK